MRATAITCLGHSAVQSRLKWPVLCPSSAAAGKSNKYFREQQRRRHYAAAAAAEEQCTFSFAQNRTTRVLFRRNKEKRIPSAHSRFSARCVFILYFNSVLLDRRLTKLPTSKRVRFHVHIECTILYNIGSYSDSSVFVFLLGPNRNADDFPGLSC